MTGSTAYDFRSHLLNDVLPWWLEHGPDADHGGVFTCWSNDSASLVSTDKYTWSQGRWAYLMAHLAQAGQRGVIPVDAAHLLDLARSTAQFIYDHQVLPDGTTAWVTTADGTVINPGTGAHQSVFADLFVALGWGAVAEVSGDAVWGQRARQMLRQAQARTATGNFRSEPYPVPAGCHSLAVPMILVNCGDQVYRATQDESVRQIVLQAVDDLATYHVDGADVREMPGGDPDTLMSRHRTPGHILELTWFLWHARNLIGNHSLVSPGTLARLAGHALELGWDSAEGGLLRYTDFTGGMPGGRLIGHPLEPLVQETWDTKLWWTHAEALYTTALMAKVTVEDSFALWHQRMTEYAMSHFPQGPGQEWIQNLDRDGSPHPGVVALPVKDPFHVARALLNLVLLEQEDS